MDKITNIVDAIRIGSLKHPQCFGSLMDRNYITDEQNEIIGTCALGAAVVVVFADHETINPSDYWLEERFNLPREVLEFVVECNDGRRLSRETIAAILAAREWKPYGNPGGLL